jgi:hypothetical protein
MIDNHRIYLRIALSIVNYRIYLRIDNHRIYLRIDNHRIYLRIALSIVNYRIYLRIDNHRIYLRIDLKNRLNILFFKIFQSINVYTSINFILTINQY